MALGSTQPLTEMSIRNILGIFLGVKGGRRVGLTTLPPSMSRLSYNQLRFEDFHCCDYAEYRFLGCGAV
jgi:hypothetical protein